MGDSGFRVCHDLGAIWGFGTYPSLVAAAGCRLWKLLTSTAGRI